MITLISYITFLFTVLLVGSVLFAGLIKIKLI
uniref:Cytochrome b6-f complex subunit 6 n=1 Tax=Pleurastrum terricola TaxID=34116 RepID=A6YG70_PLETE|nr:subunit VI of cytochrome b6/f complex [Pleurastrum terricola]ABO69291.1 subunit VI of cytochrome b6/f complex [Pleurastrum terricola]